MRWPAFVLAIACSTSALPFQKTGYNEQEARVLLNLAAGAYADSPWECVNRTFLPAERRELLHNIGEECDIISSLCSGYVVKSDVMRHLILVFRGTKTKAQLLLEGLEAHNDGIDFYGLGDVNRYFSNAHVVLWKPMERVLKDARYRGYSVTITGHSLGGALAALAAARIVHDGLRQGGQVRLVTFGEPRIGSRVFAKNFDRLVPNSYRVVFRADIVPHLPACRKDLSDRRFKDDDSRPCDDYDGSPAYHHGTEIWYPDCMDPGCKFVECTGLPQDEDFQCSDKLKFNLGDTSDYVSDHRNYFGLKVTDFGKTGCDGVFNASYIEAQRSPLEKLATTLASWATSIFG